MFMDVIIKKKVGKMIIEIVKVYFFWVNCILKGIYFLEGYLLFLY